MSSTVSRNHSGMRRSVRVVSSTLAVGALVAGTMAVTTTTADAAKNRTWNRLAQCESGGRWHINSTYDGGLQFSPSTWRGYGGGKFAPYAYKAKRWEQIAIAQRVLRGQGWGAWPACSASLGLDHSDAVAPWEGRPRKVIKSFSGKNHGSANLYLHSMSGKKHKASAFTPLR
ncbi:transglycosylase family protein [Solicola gregarius]|uniref:Transglycosylase family protein n=1 Tax=Solicola gregarius TaxID=2908642 RepID=A0AA46TGU3_9ACTN|nr:transglycosylase family protein [Solicola gregarius]UYM04881.1 transglycosylase family protein [Solicola gregarius]